MKENRTLQSTFKSADTEEWFDIVFTRPLGYLWARFFQFFGIHPNVVTVISIILGAAGGLLLAPRDIYINLLGILLIVWANIYDSTDGQLARMTGKKSRLGRVLDGFCGDVWFFCIYFAICVRLTPVWGIWIWLFCAFAGFICHGRQCKLADYYRNIHLYFVGGKGKSELDNSVRLKEEFRNTKFSEQPIWKVFLYFYCGYTLSQEKMTPRFQQFYAEVSKRFGTEIPQELRDEFRSLSLPLMKYANILTFNTRAAVLYVSVLADVPWMYPLIEVVVFNALAFYMHHRHETICRRLQHKGYSIN